MKILAMTSIALTFVIGTGPTGQAHPPQEPAVVLAHQHVPHPRLDATTHGIHPTDLTNKVLSPWYDIPSVAAPNYRAKARREIIGTAYFDEPMLRVPAGVNPGLPRSGGYIGGAFAAGTHVSFPYYNYRAPWYTHGAASYQRTIHWYGPVK